MLTPPDWYVRWVVNYVASFGAGDDLNRVMVQVWWPAFAAAGFIERDFAAALPRLLTAEQVPNWPREHLAAVNRELRAARDRRMPRTQTAAVPTGPRCALCDWTGWVEVPHPECVRDGEWQAPFTRGCVACTRCGPGQRKYRAALEHTKAAPMTLDHYELRIDAAWAEHLAERREAERLMREAEIQTESVKPVKPRPSGFPKLARDMAARSQPPKERQPTPPSAA